MTEKGQAIIVLLKKKEIPFELQEHPEVYTVEEGKKINLLHPESMAKNLFLRDDKKTNYYLVTMNDQITVDLKILREKIASRRLSFASEEDLMRILKLEKGSVTPFGIFNDKEKMVTVILDEAFRGKKIGVHPNENIETVWLNTDDLVNLLKEHGNSVKYVDFEANISM